MDTAILGRVGLVLLVIGVIGFPIFDRVVLARLPPAERTESGGTLTIEPFFSYVFSALLGLLGIGALHSGVWLQRDPVALVFAIVCFVSAWFSFRAHRLTRVRWNTTVIEQPQGTGKEPTRITWDEIREVTPNAARPECIYGHEMRKISLSFCRGRAVFLNDARARRPDLFLQ